MLDHLPMSWIWNCLHECCVLVVKWTYSRNRTLIEMSSGYSGIWNIQKASQGQKLLVEMKKGKACKKTATSSGWYLHSLTGKRLPPSSSIAQFFFGGGLRLWRIDEITRQTADLDYWSKKCRRSSNEEACRDKCTLRPRRGQNYSEKLFWHHREMLRSVPGIRKDRCQADLCEWV